MNVLAKIFGKKVDEKALIEEIHNEFDTAPQRLLEEAMSIIATNSVKVTLESEIEEKATRLEKVGFVKNGLVAKKKEIVERNKLKQAQVEITMAQANVINHYSVNYPFLKFLTIDELDRICDKYGLVYAPVGNYKMPVPDKNLSEIENAQPLNYNDKEKPKITLRIPSSQQWGWSMPSDLCKILDKGFVVDSWDTLPTRVYDSEAIKLAREFGGYTGTYSGFVTKAYGKAECSSFNRDGLFIAAPKKHFDLKGLKFDKNKGYFTFTKTVVQSDPIVFRYVKGGIQVLTKWGLEANDPALQMEILN